MQTRKRAREVAAAKCNPSWVIKDNVLLTAVLSWSWPDAAGVALTCRRFAALVRSPNFWLHVVRRELLRKYGGAGSKHVALILDWVNPFYRFPKHMPSYEPWPFSTFLQWLFPKRYPHADAIAQVMTASVAITLRTECSLISFIEHDNYHHCIRWDIWDEQKIGGAMPSKTYMSQEAPRESGMSSGYYVMQDGRYTWCDATLMANGPVWCGLVTEGKTVTTAGFEIKLLSPWLGQGCYKQRSK